VTIQIEIGEATIGMWSIRVNDYMNWLAHLAREPNGDFLFTYRFRHDNDDDPHCNWYKGTVRGVKSEHEAIERVRRAVSQMLDSDESMVGWELLKGARSIEEFSRALAQMPGITMRKVGEQ
jgi:hypothetical protein